MLYICYATINNTTITNIIYRRSTACCTPGGCTPLCSARCGRVHWAPSEGAASPPYPSDSGCLRTSSRFVSASTAYMVAWLPAAGKVTASSLAAIGRCSVSAMMGPAVRLLGRTRAVAVGQRSNGANGADEDEVGLRAADDFALLASCGCTGDKARGGQAVKICKHTKTHTHTPHLSAGWRPLDAP